MKNKFYYIFIMFSTLTFGQAISSKAIGWNTTGNNTKADYWLGTKNAFDFVIKTNNYEGFKLFKNGGIRFKQYNSSTDYQEREVI